MNYLILFFAGVLVEAIVVILLVWRQQQYALHHIIWVTLMMNAATHPLFMFAFPYIPLPYVIVLLLGETFAIVLEWMLLQKSFQLARRFTFTVSLLANFMSWQITVPLLAAII